MKRGRAFGVFIALLVILHFALHITFGVGDRAPDLLTLAVLLAARQLTTGPATGTGFLVGLLGDSVSLSAFGAGALTQALTGFLGSRSRDLFVGDSVLFLTLYLFVGAWLQDALYFWVAPAVRQSAALNALLVRAPLEAAYVAAAGMIAILTYRAVRR